MSLREYGIVCDDEPTYTTDEKTTDEKQVIGQFRSQFQRIKEMGYVKSHRSNNTGIGKTFEDLMGIDENNVADVDFMDFIEIKSKREASQSMLTLFTKSPDYPVGSNKYLCDTYGMIDETTGLKRLHTTISGKEYNTFGGDIGFKLRVDCTAERIYISIKSLNTNEILEEKVYYTFETLQKIISKKCANIAFVNADSKITNGIEYFKFTDVQLLTGLTFEKFLDGIREGHILYDIRIGTYRSGRMRGRPHDHGSGFRIKKDYIDCYFTVNQL